MSRIVYLTFSGAGVAGGLKMAFRHVETLRELGFDAVCWMPPGNTEPTWFDHQAPLDRSGRLRPDDVVVVAEDAAKALGTLSRLTNRTVVFCQNQFHFGVAALGPIDQFPIDRFPTFLTPGETAAGTIRRIYPQASVAVVPCFADERMFRPAAQKRLEVAYLPRKRPNEARFVRAVMPRLHARHADLAWREVSNVPEREVARALGSAALFLSLSRFEAVGMATLEAMASGCVCAGFTGVGGREYATTENGFWVPEDDCEAAVEALAEAADVVKAGGPRLTRLVEAGQETARRWSHTVFRRTLEDFWSRSAPEARGL